MILIGESHRIAGFQQGWKDFPGIRSSVLGARIRRRQTSLDGQGHGGEAVAARLVQSHLFLWRSLPPAERAGRLGVGSRSWTHAGPPTEKYSTLASTYCVLILPTIRWVHPIESLGPNGSRILSSVAPIHFRHSTLVRAITSSGKLHHNCTVYIVPPVSA